MNIIKNRVERAIKIGRGNSKAQRYQVTRAGERRRETYLKGVKRYRHMSFTITHEIAERLEKVCGTFRINRSLIARDAFDMWLSMAEHEIQENGVDTTMVRKIK